MDVKFWIGYHCASLVPDWAWQCGIDSDWDLKKNDLGNSYFEIEGLLNHILKCSHTSIPYKGH